MYGCVIPLENGLAKVSIKVLNNLMRKRRKEKMKKIVCIIAVVLMIVSVVYAAEKKGITAKDLPGMKGVWTGNISFGIFDGGGSSACTLEIFNDTVPVKAKLSISNIPSVVAQPLGLQSGPNTMEGDNGKITSQGTLMWTGPAEGFFEVSKKGDKKIGANYWFKGLRGDASLSKK